MTTILVVDDNARNLRFLKDALEAHGYIVHTARSGFEALERTESLRPDLVLMDVQMPGMSGTEAMRRFKAAGALKNVPVLALTALAMKGDEAQLLEAGFDGYLSKPLTLREMLGTVRTFLGEEDRSV